MYPSSRQHELRGAVFTILALLILCAAAIILPGTLRDEARIAGYVTRMVNDERAATHEHPLVVDPLLARLAEDYSRRMLQYHFFWHNRRLVESEALRKQPIEEVVRHYGPYIAENIVETPVGFSTRCGLTLTNKQIAACMVRLWEQSKPHRETMLSGQYGATGIGISCNLVECKGTQYFTPKAEL